MSTPQQEKAHQAAAAIQQAGAMLAAGDADGAIALLYRLIEAIPELVQARELLTRLLMMLDRPAETAPQFDAITEALLGNRRPGPDCDADALHHAALYFKSLYASIPWRAASEDLIGRAVTLWRLACRDRLDLCYLAGITLCEIGFHEEAGEIFAQGRAIKASMAEVQGSLDCRLRFVLGDTSISATIPGIPNLMTGVGHIAFLDYYLKAIRLGWVGDVEPVMLLKDSPVINRPYLDLFRPLLRIIEDEAEIERLRPLALAHEEMLNNEMLLNGQPMWTLHAVAAVETEWTRRGLAPLLSLPEAARAAGRDALAALGLTGADWFVCLHVRDNGFRRERETCGDNRGLDNTNNADIATYEAAIDAILEAGGWVIRMGDPAMVPLPFTRARVIDYARSDLKSAAMDVFLCAECRFFLGTSSGLCLLPGTFGVPTVHTNWTPPYARPWGGRDLFLPKLTRRRSDGALLPFLQAWAKPIGRAFRPELFASHGLEVADNGADEILAATREMMARLEGRDPGDSPAEAGWRQRYDSLIGLAGIPQGGYGTNARIARAFLAKYQHLLP